jgi:hypothetical protein
MQTRNHVHHWLLVLIGSFGFAACTQQISQPQLPKQSVRLAVPVTVSAKTAIELQDFDERAWSVAHELAVAYGLEARADPSASGNLPDGLADSLKLQALEIVTTHPELLKQPVWLGEVSQLVQANNADQPSNSLVGLAILMTENTPGHPTWAAKIAFDLENLKVLSWAINSDPERNPIPPTVIPTEVGDQRPYTRRILEHSSINQPDLSTETLEPVLLLVTPE